MKNLFHMLHIVTRFTYIWKKYRVNYRNMMKTNMFFMTTILSLVILTASTTMPALALGDTVQQISTKLDGFVVMYGCCPDASVQIQGNVVTASDGIMTLSSQSGSFLIGEKIYTLKFEPTGNVSTKSDGICLSSINNEQTGAIELTENDGIVLKGFGVYSWGKALGCPDGDSSFTNFSGKFQDAQGQTIDFYFGTDSLPVIQ